MCHMPFLLTRPGDLLRPMVVLLAFDRDARCRRYIHPPSGPVQADRTRCAERGISGVYIEGGASLLSSFVRYQFLHYLFAYRAPRLLADTSGLAPFMGQEPATMEDAIQLRDVRHAVFGDDQLMRGFVVYPDK